MKLAIDIVKNVLLPKLEKDANFDANKTNRLFWESVATILLDFERDAKPLYTAIYSLELNDPEKIISKLSNVYNSYIEELAEYHVLGTSSKATDYLLTSKNETFANKVQFFSNLEKVIKKTERKRIKKELPNAYERLTFELSEKDIELVLKKKEREALKEKMRAWDEELVVEEVPVIPMPRELVDKEMKPAASMTEPKVISLWWIQYAVAACLVLGTGFWFYENQTQGVIPTNTVGTAPDKKEPSTKTNVIPVIPMEALAEVSTVSKSYPVEEETGFGFTSKTKKISIVENNQEARKLSIGKAIEKYQMQLEKEFATHKVGYDSIIKELKSRIDSLQNELQQLKVREQQYLFDGKVLTLYTSSSSKENQIILYEDTYYIKKDNHFYKLSVSKQPQLYDKVTDSNVLTALDKIIFDNE